MSLLAVYFIGHIKCLQLLLGARSAHHSMECVLPFLLSCRDGGTNELLPLSIRSSRLIQVFQAYFSIFRKSLTDNIPSIGSSAIGGRRKDGI